MLYQIVVIVILGISCITGLAILACCVFCFNACLDSAIEAAIPRRVRHSDITSDDGLSMAPVHQGVCCEHDIESSHIDDDNNNHIKLQKKNNYMLFCHPVNSKSSKKFPMELMRSNIAFNVV